MAEHPPRASLLLLLSALGTSSGYTRLLSRRVGEFTDFRGRRVSFGSVQKVSVPLAGASTAELQEYLTPDTVATAMWDPRRVKRLDDDGRYQLRMERLSFVMLEIDTAVSVRVAKDGETGDITLTSEDFSLEAKSPAGRLNTAQLGIKVNVAGQLQILNGGTAVGGKVGFETEGDLPPLMLFTPQPVVAAAMGGMNRAVMGLVVGEFERGFRNDFAAWRRRMAANNPTR